MFVTKGGSQFEGYPLPSNRLGSSIPYTAFSTAFSTAFLLPRVVRSFKATHSLPID
jgi:hypothetical protein